MRVHLSYEEWYPVIEVDSDDMGSAVDVPDDLVERYRLAMGEFIAVQQLLEPYYNLQSWA